jgi:hypothetical protein
MTDFKQRLKMQIIRIIWIIVLSFCLFTSKCVNADTIYYTSSSATADAQGGDGNPGSSYDSGQQSSGTATPTLIVTDNTVSSSATGTARVSAEFGHLHGFGSAKIATLRAFGDANATATGNAAWSDVITVTSNDLEPGTFVEFMATMTLHDTIEGSGDVALQGNVSASVFGGNFDLAIADSLTSPTTRHTVSQTFLIPVGAQREIDASLSFIAYATYFGGTPASGEVDVNAANTADFSLIPLTPGVSYTTASGARYDPVDAAAAPLPSPLAAGVVLLISCSAIAALRSRQLRLIASR